MGPGSDSPKSLAHLTWRCLGDALLGPVFPRITVTGFTFAQPFLVNSMLSQLDDSAFKPISHGYGLIGASALIYIGIAVSGGQHSPPSVLSSLTP